MENFWLELFIRLDQLSVKIDSSQRITVVTTDKTIWIQTRNHHKCIQFPKKFRFLFIAQQEIEHSFKNIRCWCFSRMNPRCYQNYWTFPYHLGVPCNGNLPNRQITHWSAELLPSVKNELVFVFKLNTWKRLWPIFRFFINIPLLFCDPIVVIK